MLNHLKIQSKILILVIIPTIGTLFFSINASLEKYGATVKMAHTAQLVDLSSDVSVLAHNLQREAAASAAFVSSGSEGVPSLADLARSSMDAEKNVAQRLQTYDIGSASSELKAVLDDGLLKAHDIAALRAQVSSRSVQAAQMNGAFTAAIVRLLDFSLIAPKAIDNANVNRSMRLYAYLLQAAEASSAARANAAIGFGAGKFDLATYQTVLKFLTRQGDFVALIDQAATPAQRDFYAATYSGRPVDETARMIQVMMDVGPAANVSTVTQEAWLAANADRMRLYGEVEKRFEQDLRAATVEAKDAAEAQLETQVILTAVLLALTGVLAFLIARSITRPIKALVASMDMLAKGNTGLVIPQSDWRDEIGEMARSLLVFQRAAIESARLERDAHSQRAAAEAERATNEAARLDAARQMSVVVSAVAAGLGNLAKGDLVFRLNDRFADEYEQLRVDFNAAMETLQEAIRLVAANARAIQTGTAEISKASDDLSRRTEQQAASLEQTAAALDQITATVRKTADGAGHAQAIVSTAKNEAEQSGGVVREAVQAMSEIEKSSEQISQIIGVIDEIAFQTNLLALNAGVEAARAGDAGRGFAVVASEVRSLAQRSAEAAKEIKALISTSSRQVSRGVKLVDVTGESLQRIAGHVVEVFAAVTDIAASAKEQATGLHEVNTAVNQMDQVTQQNAAMVEQTTAASHSLAQEGDELAQLTQRFRVGSTVGRTRADPAPQRGTVVPMGKTSGRGGALRKPDPVADAQGWAEF